MSACEWCWTRASHLALLSGHATADLYHDVLAQQDALGPHADCPEVRAKMSNRFRVRDIVQPSSELAKLHPRIPATRRGTVQAVYRTDSVEIVCVRWAGRGSDEPLHASYLEMVERPT